MGHADIENLTPFTFAATLAMDECGRILYVLIVKATYVIGSNNALKVAENQIPIDFSGECWGKPEESSYKYEPEVAFFKPTTDVVLIGTAYVLKAGDRQVDIRFRVGRLEKVVRVIGDRYWIKSFGIALISPPEPFESMPLVYERAFGGWDRGNPDPKKHDCEPKNPVGTGFISRRRKVEEGGLLPNLEDPRYLINGFLDRPPPAGFGFTSPHWQPRASFGGTYDETWMTERRPLVPKDFDRRFFNAASTGLIAEDYFKGDEAVLIENVSTKGRVAFNLPGIPAPCCRVRLKDLKDLQLEMRLDTVIINSDERLLLLIWRSHVVLRDGPHDVLAVKVQSEGVQGSAVLG